MTNEAQEQVVNNSNTSSDTIKKHYVFTDVKSDNEVIFDFYPTSMSKRVDWEIHSDGDEFEEKEDKVFLTEKDAENAIEQFKKEGIDYNTIRDEIQDRFYDNYTIHCDDEDENGNVFVPEENIDTSTQKVSVSDFIKSQIEKRDKLPMGWYGRDKSSNLEKENIIMEQLNNQLRRSDVDYKCVRLLSDNLVTFGLIKKEKNDETKTN